jgi:hypothetical protein
MASAAALRSFGGYKTGLGREAYVYTCIDHPDGRFSALRRYGGDWIRSSLTIGDLTGYDSDWRRIEDAGEVMALIIEARACLR